MRWDASRRHGLSRHHGLSCCWGSVAADATTIGESRSRARGCYNHRRVSLTRSWIAERGYCRERLLPRGAIAEVVRRRGLVSGGAWRPVRLTALSPRPDRLLAWLSLAWLSLVQLSLARLSFGPAVFWLGGVRPDCLPLSSSVDCHSLTRMLWIPCHVYTNVVLGMGAADQW